MFNQRTVALMLCLVFYGASFAYVLVMDQLVMSPNHVQWTDLKWEERAWIMGPMFGLQAMGMIIWISNLLDSSIREDMLSKYQGTKYPFI